MGRVFTVIRNGDEPYRGAPDQDHPMVMVIDVGALFGKTLHSHDMDNFLAALGDASDLLRSDLPPFQFLTIDLSNLTYVTPSGLTWLLVALHALRNPNRRKQEPSIDIPTSEGRQPATNPTVRVIPPGPPHQLHYWLKWMGFFEFVEEHGIACDWEKPKVALPPDAERRLKSQTVLVLTELRTGVDVARVVREVTGSVATLLQNHLGYTGYDVAILGMMLSEACHNILDHAGEDACGLVAAQVIRRSKQLPYVQIGVADNGIGIRSSLSRAHPDASTWPHEQAIREALKRGVSGVPEEDRGLGLWSIVDKITDYQGTLHLRSGDARVRVKAREDGSVDYNVYPSHASVPGTMLCLTLRKRT
ncbi:MAG: ATP-binding protein [Capsulimonadales bacterium]|nr:ATP-binding protein [Capsulimonadales bacterium]